MGDSGLVVANSIKVLTQNGECQIDLCLGDITKLKKKDKVDVICVSAFRGKCMHHSSPSLKNVHGVTLS